MTAAIGRPFLPTTFGLTRHHARACASAARHRPITAHAVVLQSAESFRLLTRACFSRVPGEAYPCFAGITCEDMGFPDNDYTKQ
jgi:hypothetical protein